MKPNSASPARVCLVTFGSAGDVHPMLALGKQLRANGRSVTLLTNPAFSSMAADAGLDFIGVGEEQHYRDTLHHPKLWHPIDGFGVMWRYLLRPALEPTYKRLTELAASGPCVVVATPVAMGARIANEHTGVPLITAYTAATMLRTVYNPMTLAHWRVAPLWPKTARRLAWALLDRYKLEPMVRPALEAVRRSAGLAPVQVPIFGQWLHSPNAGVTLFPSWFAPAPLDWPAQVVQAGFPLFDGDAEQAESPELKAFMAGGTPPVVFMPGTAQHDTAAFFQSAIQACAQTSQRGLLLGPVDASIRNKLPAGIRAEPYAPFSRVLPKSRAIVHHGGVGTCAQALRAGIPQLLLPQAYDQFDNAMRLEKLGVGMSLAPGPRGPASMGEQLGKLINSSKVASACKQWAPRTSAQRTHEVVAELVERFS